MGLSRSLFYLTTLLTMPAQNALADGGNPAPATDSIPALHIQIINPGQKAVYDGVLRDLPDERGVKGGWVKQQAVRSALERDPDTAIRAFQMVAHPGELPATDQIVITKEQYELAMKVLQSVPPIPLPGTPVGVDIASIARFADAMNSVTTYELKQQGIDPDQAKRDLMNLVENQPGLLDGLADQMRGNLVDPTISAELLSADGKLRGQLEGLVSEGKLPDINGDQDNLVEGLNPNMVTQKLATLLADETDDQLSAMRNDPATTLRFLSDNRDALLDQSSEIDDLQKKTDVLIGNLADQRAKAERDASLANAKGGVATAAGLLRLMDPSAAKAASDIETFGNAVINGEQAIVSLAGGFSLAATGNLVGAVGSIAGLFSHQQDIAAIRQQQIMDGLSHLSKQLDDISHKLDLIDGQLTSIKNTLDQLALQGDSQFQTLMSELAEISAGQAVAYEEEIRLANGLIQTDIIGEGSVCADHIKHHLSGPFPSMQDYLLDRLSNLSGKTRADDVNPAIDLTDFVLDDKATIKVSGFI